VSTPAENRRTLLAQIHVAKKELALDDATYRAVLWEQIHRESAGKATVPELEKLVRHFAAKGWKKKPGKKAKAKKLASYPQAKKIRALWLTLAEAGVVRHSDEIALRAYVKRLTGMDHLSWLDGKQAGVVIESLKSWCKRERVEVE
jgi:phage gp16-like protein